MPDLSTLIVVVGLFLTAVVGNAALYGDTLQVHITVPSKLADDGFTEIQAEQLFSSDVIRVARPVSLVAAPGARISSRQTVLAALAKPLGLDGIVIIPQQKFGVDVATVEGTLQTGQPGNALAMILLLTDPHGPPAVIQLTETSGNAAALVTRSALLVL